MLRILKMELLMVREGGCFLLEVGIARGPLHVNRSEAGGKEGL